MRLREHEHYGYFVSPDNRVVVLSEVAGAWLASCADAQGRRNGPPRLAFDRLTTCRAGVSVAQVLEATGAELVLAPEPVGEIAPPPPSALSSMEIPNVA